MVPLRVAPVVPVPDLMATEIVLGSENAPPDPTSIKPAAMLNVAPGTVLVGG